MMLYICTQITTTKKIEIMAIQFYIIKESEIGEDIKQIVTPEPSELKVGLSNQKWMPKGIVSMVKPLRTSTLYYETI